MRSTARALLVVAAISAVATACSSTGSSPQNGTSSSSASATSIKVGMIAPLAGPFAPLG